MSILDVQNLRVRYHEGKADGDVLKGVSFSVEKGETVGIIGESGSGKSTAMLAVMGLLDAKARVLSDHILVGGGKPCPGKNIAMVFQDSLNCLNPSVKIGRQVAETVRARRKCSRKEAALRTEELLDTVGIRSPKLRMEQYPFELSGGMRQRVVIAIALACEPQIILADEPTTALDAAVQAQIILLLKRIVRKTDTSLLLVSHDPGVTAALCSRVYVMRKGQMVESGTAEDVFYFPKEEYTKRLLGDRIGKGYKAGEEPCGDPLVCVRNVTKEYDTKEGIYDISLDIGEGETVAIAGESGSGKTTLARVITGLLEADAGHLYYRGQELDGSLRKTLGRGKFQMVFQDPYGSLNPVLTAGQALDESLRPIVRGEPALRRRKVEAMLALVGLSAKDAGKYPSEFSGGERQRIGLARALIAKPDLLVCDEALSALDTRTREQILELLKTVREKERLSCLFISHDLHAVRRISSRVGVMYGGRLAELGRTKDICSDPWHPYTRLLLDAVPKADPVRAGRFRGAVAEERGTEKRGIEKEGRGCPFAANCTYAMKCCAEEMPGQYSFGDRQVSCFLYSEKHSGRRAKGYTMTSQI